VEEKERWRGREERGICEKNDTHPHYIPYNIRHILDGFMQRHLQEPPTIEDSPDDGRYRRDKEGGVEDDRMMVVLMEWVVGGGLVVRSSPPPTINPPYTSLTS